MIIYEIKEGYDNVTCIYRNRCFFPTIEEAWEYLTMDDDVYTYLYKDKELTYTMFKNNMGDHRHSRTIVSGRGKRYEVTSYEIIENLKTEKEDEEAYIH